MIDCDLLKLSFVWNFCNNAVGRVLPYIFGTAKQDCVIKARKMLIFLNLINNFGTIG